MNYCAICYEPIEADDLGDRHWGHEADCPNQGRDPEDETEMVDCTCNLEYHADCCPDCNLDD